MKQALCHPNKEYHARGLCRSCYNKEPDILARERVWRKSEKRKIWARNYDRGEVRATVFRRHRHSFTLLDELRFKAAINCDWCGLSLNNELPSIDHDRRCCNSSRHCVNCTRGFVHQKCNIMSIAYYEWIEKEFGVIDLKLLDYRKRFPVPRGL